MKYPIRLKARWRSPQDMRNFFDNNCEPTDAKISGKIVEIYFENDRFVPQIKKATSNKIESLILDNAKGSKDLEGLNMENCFSYPKKVSLLKKVLEMSNIANDDLVLDFFSGSATFAHAVLEYNYDNSYKIKYILCQFPSELDEDYRVSDENGKVIIEKQIKLCNECRYPHTLDYIGIERLKRAAAIIKKEKKADIDYGFKHYALVDKKDSLDMLEKFNPTFASGTQDEILKEFSIESRLITFLCDDGFGLNAKYEAIDLEGYKGFLIDGYLYLLDKGFDIKQISELIQKVDKSEIVLKKIVLFGYAFDTRSLQQLKDNAEKFGIDDKKDIIIKF